MDFIRIPNEFYRTLWIMCRSDAEPRAACWAFKVRGEVIPLCRKGLQFAAGSLI